MKNSKITYLLIVLLSMDFLLSSCNSNSTEQNTEENLEVGIEESTELGKEYTSAYVCPMHCEGSGSETPGNCPVCNMEYQENGNLQMEDHEGHND
ncbi:MAG: hypothetical protein H6579_06630 [Chitinophagales bacterium]|nr:hypothetical protein [Chitinophagales bacterium]